MRRLILTIILLLIPCYCAAANYGMIIPYYPWPSVSPPAGYVWWNNQTVPYTPNPMPNTDTATIISLAQQYPNVPIYVAVNGGYDGFWRHNAGSQYDSDFNTAVNQLRAAGVKVLGYVYTTSGTNANGFADYNLMRTAAQAESDIDAWLSMYPQIDGFFFDEYTANSGGLSYYQTICQYAHSKKPFLVGNPGGAAGSQWFNFTGAPDVVLIYESPGNPSIGYLTGAGGTASQRGIIPYNITSANTPNSTIASYLPYSNYVYFEDAGNNVGGYTLPWQYISTFLTRQVSYLSSLNPTASPTPAVSRATMSASFR